MTAYYNEIDPYAAAWLRNLISQNLIAPGEVDERSIEDVTPDDLRGFTQCHFFAGIGVWSYALRRAGWPDDRPVWTGSCPCQPFSAAGKRGGTADERHLWPAFFHLIDAHRPTVVLGEQVASKDGLNWLDTVQADLEGALYATGAVDLCAAGVGAPHIRQRLWFVGARLEHAPSDGRVEGRSESSGWSAASGCVNGGLADSDDEGLEGRAGQPERAAQCAAWQGSVAGGLGNAGRAVLQPRVDLRDDAGPQGQAQGEARQLERGGAGHLADGAADELRDSARPGPTNGFWRDSDWLFCRDERWRPVETGTFPLAHGAPARVGRLRAYGNAIVAEAAREFIGATMDILDASPVDAGSLIG